MLHVKQIWPCFSISYQAPWTIPGQTFKFSLLFENVVDQDVLGRKIEGCKHRGKPLPSQAGKNYFGGGPAET